MGRSWAGGAGAGAREGFCPGPSEILSAALLAPASEHHEHQRGPGGEGRGGGGRKAGREGGVWGEQCGGGGGVG